ncbi:MAG: hemolysin family protein, partial [Promicromonosporaceae bacterium]|nr:hemolysin family protein [Promicromonosporaceae bacterium]
MSAPLAIAIGVLLLIGNAFFVGAEFSLISARRSAIEPLAASGNRRAGTVLWAMEHLSLMLATAQVGVTACSVGLGVVAEPAVVALLEGPLAYLRIPSGLVRPIALVVALAMVVLLHVVLGEMLPKNLVVATPESAAMWFTPPLVMVGRALRPLIASLNALANGFVRLTGVEPRDEVASAYTAAEVQSIMEYSEAAGTLADSHGLLGSAIEFSVRTAADVMTPVGEVVTVGLDVTPAEYERRVAKTGYSRFPVAAEGDVLGYLHLKDVLYAAEDDRDRPIEAWRVRRLIAVKLSAEIEDVLRVM